MKLKLLSLALVLVLLVAVAPVPAASGRETSTPTVPVREIRVSPQVITLQPGETDLLDAYVIPYTATEQGVYWTSSDTQVVTVDQEGTIAAIHSGMATVTATSNDGGYTGSCAVVVAGQPKADGTEYTVTTKLTGLLSDAPEKIAEGDLLEACFRFQTGGSYSGQRSMPSSILVTMGGQTLAAGKDYIYIAPQVVIGAVTGDVTITAAIEVSGGFGQAGGIDGPSGVAGGTVTVSTSSSGAMTATYTDSNGRWFRTISLAKSKITMVEKASDSSSVSISAPGLPPTLYALSADTKIATVTVKPRVSSASLFSSSSSGGGGGSWGSVGGSSTTSATSTNYTMVVSGVSVGETKIYMVAADTAPVSLSDLRPDAITIPVTVTKAASTPSSSGNGARPSGGGGGGGAATTQPVATPVLQKFTDIEKDSWYEAPVQFVVNQGLFNGVSDNAFAPNAFMTRGMVMTVLARLDGKNTEGGTVWYQKGMDWAVSTGISDGSDPDGKVTREQLATMLYRYVKADDASGQLSGFVDADSVSDWSREAMGWAVSKGIVIGKGGGILDPQGNATRAEVAAMLQRFVSAR